MVLLLFVVNFAWDIYVADGMPLFKLQQMA